MLIFLSIGLVVAQMIFDDANEMALWTNWVIAGAIAVGIWHITKRYHLCSIYDGKAVTISWPLLSVCMNFSLCHFMHTEQFYMGVLLLLAMLMSLSLVLSVWQDKVAIGRHMLVGLIIGITSTMLPHTLLWLLLLPFVGYHMRCWSLRNTFSAITGAVLGVWFVYCGLFFYQEFFVSDVNQALISADQMLLRYAAIISPDSYNLMSAGFGLWHWLFLGLMALLVVVYSISAMLLNVGNSVRTGASISLISTLSITIVVLLFLDITHLSLYISLLALFLSIQLTIHQANVHSAFNEWWTIFILLSMIALTALPLWI